MRVSKVSGIASSPKMNNAKQTSFGRFFGDAPQKAVIETAIRNANDCFYNRHFDKTRIDTMVDDLSKVSYLQFALNEKGQLVVMRNDHLLKNRFTYGFQEREEILWERMHNKSNTIVNPSPKKLAQICDYYFILKHRPKLPRIIYIDNSPPMPTSMTPEEFEKAEQERRLSYLAF